MMRGDPLAIVEGAGLPLVEAYVNQGQFAGTFEELRSCVPEPASVLLNARKKQAPKMAMTTLTATDAMSDKNERCAS